MSKVCKHCNLTWEDQKPVRYCTNCGRILRHVNDTVVTNRVGGQEIARDKIKESYKNFWLNYFEFQGRCRRSDYWQAILINAIIFVILRLLMYSPAGNVFKILYIVFWIAQIIPGLSISVRRLHDIGKPWFSLFIVLIPLFGAVMLIIWYVTDSEYGDNQYGKNPKYIEERMEKNETGTCKE